jgi:hypothetical protein
MCDEPVVGRVLREIGIEQDHRLTVAADGHEVVIERAAGEGCSLVP